MQEEKQKAVVDNVAAATTTTKKIDQQAVDSQIQLALLAAEELKREANRSLFWYVLNEDSWAAGSITIGKWAIACLLPLLASALAGDRWGDTFVWAMMVAFGVFGVATLVQATRIVTRIARNASAAKRQTWQDYKDLVNQNTEGGGSTAPTAVAEVSSSSSSDEDGADVVAPLRQTERKEEAARPRSPSLAEQSADVVALPALPDTIKPPTNADSYDNTLISHDNSSSRKKHAEQASENESGGGGGVRTRSAAARKNHENGTVAPAPLSPAAATRRRRRQ